MRERREKAVSYFKDIQKKKKTQLPKITLYFCRTCFIDSPEDAMYQ